MNGLVFFLLLSTCLFLVIYAQRENGLRVTVRSSIAYVRHNGRRNKVSQVEVSPGAIKHDIEKYPDKFFERRLKYLLKRKAEKEKAKKKPK